ncbi:MAG: sulfatase-like hydrolase/transferase, partial [Bacteroidota bacterium]
MRRLGPLLVALAVAAVAAAGCARTAPEAVGPEAVGPEAVAAPPNVVVVLADDLGFSDLGLMGSGIATPVLDSLARTGLLFPQAYNGAKCSPSRAMLMTGRSAHAAGMGDAIAGLGRERPAGPYQGYLDPAVPTLAERLAEAGYRSYLSGKWHLGEERPRWPIERGFDRTFGLISGASSYYTLRTDQRRVRQMTLDGAPFAPPASGFYMTHAFADTAVAFLREHAAEHADRPFALYLAFTAPHWPLHAPEATVQKYAGRYDDGWDAERARRTAALTEAGLVPEGAPLPGRPASVPAWADRSDADRTDADWPRRMEVHAAMVDEMDAALGRVLAQVRAMGVAENTLVLFTSD